MGITYYKIRLGNGIICTFKCTAPLQKFHVICEIIRTNYELLDVITV